MVSHATYERRYDTTAFICTAVFAPNYKVRQFIGILVYFYPAASFTLTTAVALVCNLVVSVTCAKGTHLYATTSRQLRESPYPVYCLFVLTSTPSSRRMPRLPTADRSVFNTSDAMLSFIARPTSQTHTLVFGWRTACADLVPSPAPAPLAPHTGCVA